MNKKITVHVGYCDDKPHIYECEYDGRCIAVYPSRRAAKENYDDVRRATLTIEQPKRASKGKEESHE